MSHPHKDPVVMCPKCGYKMSLMSSPSNAYKNGAMRFQYGCNQFGCDTKVGAHPDGSIMGVPAGAVVRNLRIVAHKLCSKIWGDMNTIQKWKKNQMYDWLRKNSKSGHMAQMEEKELREVIGKLEQELAWRIHNQKIRNQNMPDPDVK